MSGGADVLKCSVGGCGKPLPSTMSVFRDMSNRPALNWTHVSPEGEAVYSEGKYYCSDCWDMKVKIARDGVVVYLETELLDDGGQ